MGAYPAAGARRERRKRLAATMPPWTCVVALPDSPRWEPNAPNASLVTSDETGVSQLRLRAHPDDPDQSLVIIEWVGALASTMASPNDEGRHEHPLYHSGLDALVWMGEIVGSGAAAYRTFVVPLKESTVEAIARDWSTGREPQRPLLTVGHWGSAGGSRYPNPVNLIDDSWDEDERYDVMTYLEHAAVARAYMGYSPCRICGSDNGNLELTDGTFIWPDGLVHYVRDHAIRLLEAFVGHVRQQVARWDYTGSTTEWVDQTVQPSGRCKCRHWACCRSRPACRSRDRARPTGHPPARTGCRPGLLGEPHPRPLR